MSVREIESNFDASIVLIQCRSGADFHPPSDAIVEIGSTIAVIAEVGVIKELQKANIR